MSTKCKCERRSRGLRKCCCCVCQPKGADDWHLQVACPPHDNGCAGSPQSLRHSESVLRRCRLDGLNNPGDLEWNETDFS
eukprot:scaffold3862_cov143-Cylindrotheca_fusiformis.AAC.3